MNSWGKFMAASRLAVAAFKRVYADPSIATQSAELTARAQRYDYYWSYYDNSAFEDLNAWSRYKGEHGLYRWTRSIYNPYARVVDFYAGAVYPGVLMQDPEADMPPGIQNAIPMNEDISPELYAALYQFWTWANWGQQKNTLVRKTAALGSHMVELVDDVERGKVYPMLIWPGWVDSLELDPSGNVKSYALEYQVDDEDGKEYTFRKEVDQNQFVYYKDGEEDRAEPNPYGFVPACWFRHRDLGASEGEPAPRNISKFDELNSLVSHVHDDLHKILSAPIVVSGSGAFTALTSTAAATQGETAQLTPPESGRQSLRVLKGPADSSMQSIDMPAEKAENRINGLLREIEHDHPELTFYDRLQEMSAVTGPAAARMSGNVQFYVTDAQSGYDIQSKKLFQMAIAIAGWRLGTGAWGTQTTAQQNAFTGYGLESFANGDLDMTILPRPLVPLTPFEKLQIDREQQALESDSRAISVDDALSRIRERVGVTT